MSEQDQSIVESNKREGIQLDIINFENLQPRIDSVVQKIDSLDNTLQLPTNYLKRLGYQPFKGHGYNYAVTSNNDALFLHDSYDNPKYVIKVFNNDLSNPSRYQRESKAIQLLQKATDTKGIGTDLPYIIPTTLAVDDENEVIAMNYYEDSDTQEAFKDQSVRKSYILRVAKFAADLSSLKPTDDNIKVDGHETRDATLIPHTSFLRSLNRFAPFWKYYYGGEGRDTGKSRTPSNRSTRERHPGFYQFMQEIDFENRIELIQSEILSSVPLSELHKATKPEERGFNHHDLSVNNAFTTTGGNVVVIDWEYSGWDNRFNIAGNFAYNPYTLRYFTLEERKLFVETFANNLNLSDSQRKELNLRNSLEYFQWISVITRNTIPKRWRGTHWRMMVGDTYGESSDELADEYLQVYYCKPIKKLIDEGPSALSV